MLAVGQALGPFDGVGVAWGGGLRFGWTPGGARVDDDVSIWRPGFDFELTAARNETSRGLGTVDVSMWSAALRVSLRRARGRSWFDVGAGGRAGVARLAGMPGRCHHHARRHARRDMGRTYRLRRCRQAILATGGGRGRRGRNRPARGFGPGRRRSVHLGRGTLAVGHAGDRVGRMKTGGAVVVAGLAVVFAAAGWPAAAARQRSSSASTAPRRRARPCASTCSSCARCRAARSVLPARRRIRISASPSPTAAEPGSRSTPPPSASCRRAIPRRWRAPGSTCSASAWSWTTTA